LPYPKSIDTLIPDIYKLFTDGVISSEALLEHYSKMVAEGLRDSLKQGLEGRKPRLRLSAIGKPSRKLFYELTEAPKEQLLGKTLLLFQYGHILEALILYLAKEAGHTVEDEQGEVSFEDIKGHMDARIDGVKIDVKSASPFGFKKFRNGSIREDDLFGYIPQLASYQQSDKKNPNEDGAFLAVNKVNGDMCLCKFSAAELAAVDISGHVDRQKAVQAQIDAGDTETEPERCYAPIPDGTKSANLMLDTGCTFCDFKIYCWRDSNDGFGLRAFSYYNKTKYLVHVDKEPRVDELAVEMPKRITKGVADGNG